MLRQKELLGSNRAESNPGARVMKIIYPGTTISIGKRATTFGNELKGPVTIEKRKVDNVTEFVAVNQLSGSIHVLPSMRLPFEELMAGFELEAEVETTTQNAGNSKG